MCEASLLGALHEAVQTASSHDAQVSQRTRALFFPSCRKDRIRAARVTDVNCLTGHAAARTASMRPPRGKHSSPA